MMPFEVVKPRGSMWTAGGFTVRKPPPVDPRSIPGLAAWNAVEGQLCFADTARTTFAVLPAPVQGVTDRSGNGNHLTQSVADNTATLGLAKGRLSLVFFGTRWLDWPDFLTGAVAGDIFIVWRRWNFNPASTTAGDSGGFHAGTVGNEAMYPWYDDQQIRAKFGTDTRVTIDAATSLSNDLSKFHVWHERSRPGLFEGHYNLTEYFSRASNTVAWPTNPRFGRSGGGNYFDGEFHEALVYLYYSTPYMTDAQRVALTTTLMNRHGIA